MDSTLVPRAFCRLPPVTSFEKPSQTTFSPPPSLPFLQLSPPSFFPITFSPGLGTSPPCTAILINAKIPFTEADALSGCLPAGNLAVYSLVYKPFTTCSQELSC